MDIAMKKLALVDQSVENAKTYMGEKYIGHICMDCAIENNKLVKIICGCKTNWKCETHIESKTELPSENVREFIIAKCNAKPISTDDISESKESEQDTSESKETD